MSDLKCGFHAERRKEIWQNAKASFNIRHSAAKIFIEVNYHFSLQAMHRQGDHYIIFCCYEFFWHIYLKKWNHFFLNIHFNYSMIMLFPFFFIFIFFSKSYLISKWFSKCMCNTAMVYWYSSIYPLKILFLKIWSILNKTLGQNEPHSYEQHIDILLSDDQFKHQAIFQSTQCMYYCKSVSLFTELDALKYCLFSRQRSVWNFFHFLPKKSMNISQGCDLVSIFPSHINRKCYL